MVGKKIMYLDLLALENADDVIAFFLTGHHGVCRHISQIARGIIADWKCTLLRADQLIVSRLHITSPLWSFP